jgi:hypothetical protein
VHGTVSEVDQLLGVTDCPGGATTLMSVVGRGDRVATAERLDQAADIDRSGPSAVAFLPVLAVPAGGGQPEREFDL